jgi:hypothetical protein
MEKILVISYFFSPCTLTAARRIENWAKYLNKFGYYPIIITRKWEKEIMLPKDMHYNTTSGIEIEKQESYEVHYMPYSASLRDKLFTSDRFVLFQKLLSLKEIIFQNWFLKSCPYYNIFVESNRLIEKDPAITKIIISGNPFVQFSFGYKLKKRYPKLKWIADYRDDWTTTELVKSRSFLERVILRLDRISERKWLSNSEFITSVSGHYAEKIGRFVGKDGYEVLNGFGEEIKPSVKDNGDGNRFEITYNGSLYNSQPIEPFLEVFKCLIEEFNKKVNIHLNFPGLDFDKRQSERVRALLVGYEENYTITSRIPRLEVLEMQNKSQLVLMLAHKGLKGIPSSKLYEYIGLEKPIILYPNDKDIIEQILMDTGLGIVCGNKEELTTKLKSILNTFVVSGNVGLKGNKDQIWNYSIKNQVNKLAQLLDKI